MCYSYVLTKWPLFYISSWQRSYFRGGRLRSSIDIIPVLYNASSEETFLSQTNKQTKQGQWEEGCFLQQNVLHPVCDAAVSSELPPSTAICEPPRVQPVLHVHVSSNDEYQVEVLIDLSSQIPPLPRTVQTHHRAFLWVTMVSYKVICWTHWLHMSRSLLLKYSLPVHV